MRFKPRVLTASDKSRIELDEARWVRYRFFATLSMARICRASYPDNWRSKVLAYRGGLDEGCCYGVIHYWDGGV
jgi:hypothetical protein